MRNKIKITIVNDDVTLELFNPEGKRIIHSKPPNKEVAINIANEMALNSKQDYEILINEF